MKFKFSILIIILFQSYLDVYGQVSYAIMDSTRSTVLRKYYEDKEGYTMIQKKDTLLFTKSGQELLVVFDENDIVKEKTWIDYYKTEAEAKKEFDEKFSSYIRSFPPDHFQPQLSDDKKKVFYFPYPTVTTFLYGYNNTKKMYYFIIAYTRR